MTQPAQQARNQPERKFGPYPGGVGVAVWINTIETDQGAKNIRSITINPRRYFDKASETWKDSRSFRPEDLPALIFGLQKALEHCYVEPISGQEMSDDVSPDDTPF